MDPSDLAARVTARDVRAVSSAITLLESEEPAGQAILARLKAPAQRATVIGITGYPGTGKSSLIDQLIRAYRRQDRRVGVLAVDTSSPVTGGAILGDRIRMLEHATDRGVYIRSMATRGHQGGIARATEQAVRVLEAAGYDPILIETVGVGQADVAVAEVADIVVAVVVPGLGDEVQAMKAGLLEVADLVVVNKGDREGADRTLTELRDWVPTVLRTVAVKGEGIPELLEAIAALRRARQS
jgi:LAO/AO transport system kinase